MSRTETDLREFYSGLSPDAEAAGRLQEWILRQGDQPAARTAAMERSSHLRRLALPGAVAAVIAVALVGVLVTWRAHSPTPPGPRPPLTTIPADAFITIADSRSHTETAVQLRRASDGQLLQTIVQAGRESNVYAARDADGQVVLALTSGCTTILKRVDPGTRHATSLRTLAEPVFDLAVSPDGQRVAYLTQAGCVPVTCPTGFCHFGLNQPPPTVLVVLDLRTGRSVRAPTSNYRHALQGLSWSPDAHSVVVGYEGASRKIAGFASPEYQLVILDAADPDFRTAPRIPNQPDCSAFAPSWTTTGIVAVEGCRPDPLLSPSRLVRISPEGAVAEHWNLPGCIDGASTATDPSHHQVLVQTEIGYGNGSCGTGWATRISRVTGQRLHPVMNLPGASVGITLAG